MDEITITFTAAELAVLVDSEASIYNLLNPATRVRIGEVGSGNRTANYKAAVQKIAWAINNFNFGD